MNIMNKQIANSNDWRTDGLTDWRTEKLADRWTDGLTDLWTDGHWNWNSEWNCNFRIFFYINSNCVFFNTLEKTSLAQLRSVGMNFRYNFINRVKILNTIAMIKYFSTKTQIKYIPLWGQVSKPVSEPA